MVEDREEEDDFDFAKSTQIDLGDIPVDEAEGWLVSYADLMTLLACFFILMMAFATFEKPRFQKIAREISLHFRGVNVPEEEDLLTVMISKLEEEEELKEIIEIEGQSSQVNILFDNSALFKSGSATLLPRANKLINKVILIIKSKNDDANIVIEGHTDSDPISKVGRLKEYFRSNWELSAARSSNIARKFNEAGFPGKQLRAIGYADSRPLVSNHDQNGKRISENMRKNRRILISVIKPPPKGYKMGFGLIFNSEVLTEEEREKKREEKRKKGVSNEKP